jgi:hypothetical protein
MANSASLRAACNIASCGSNTRVQSVSASARVVAPPPSKVPVSLSGSWASRSPSECVLPSGESRVRTTLPERTKPRYGHISPSSKIVSPWRCERSLAVAANSRIVAARALANGVLCERNVPASACSSMRSMRIVQRPEPRLRASQENRPGRCCRNSLRSARGSLSSGNSRMPPNCNLSNASSTIMLRLVLGSVRLSRVIAGTRVLAIDRTLRCRAALAFPIQRLSS